MDLSLSEAQTMLKSSAREFLEQQCPTSLVRAMEEDERGYVPELWSKIAELGWLGIPFPEKYEGTGGGLLDLGLLLEEMGRALFPGPFFSTVALGGLPVLDFGTAAQRGELLPKLARGELLMTMAITEPSGSYAAQDLTVRATPSGDGFRLEGTKLFVDNAHLANVMLVVARTGQGRSPEDGFSILLLDPHQPGVVLTPLKVGGGDKQSEVTFNGVVVPAKQTLGTVNGAWPQVQQALRKATALQCADMAGGARKVLEMAVAYLKSRVQFGRPIGTFQVLQHMAADMVVWVDSLQLLTYEALWTLDQGMSGEKEVAAAKAWAAEAYRNVTTTSNQMHGGIAYMKEFDHQLWLRRAKAQELKLGQARVHYDAYARAHGF
ncbi:MAG: acyl-CoA/acyl-ACP dehydrogenase [Chloroflexi bacterium]|nr:acyl-CoA/acyl-ACP dehydrogenase [Chloroflexota bacterium]